MAQCKTQLQYKPEFLKYDCTEMKEQSGNVRPLCVQCLQVLTNDSMKENKLKHHLHSVHPKFCQKTTELLEGQERTDKTVTLMLP